MESMMRRKGKAECYPYHSNLSSAISGISSCPTMEWSSVTGTTSRNQISGSAIQSQHLRTSSGSFLMDEQLSWLNDLLDEPEIPSKKESHRRSASDSFTFFDASDSIYQIGNIAEEEEFNIGTLRAQQSIDCLHKKNVERSQLGSFFLRKEPLQKQNAPENVSITPCNSQDSRARASGVSSANLENALSSDTISDSEAVDEQTPSHLLCEQELFWLYDLLDDSDTPSKKISHRRSSSDSFFYLENPRNLYEITEIAEEDEFDSGNIATQQSRGHTVNNHGERHKLTSLQRQQNLSCSGLIVPGNPSNSARGTRGTISYASQNALSDCPGTSEVVTEIESQNLEDKLQAAAHGQPMALGSSVHPDLLDIKRLKPVPVNKQSAQRSRVRKLLYIGELERTVNCLQNEVSTLSSQVAYLEHQRLLLNMDNIAVKQYTAMLAEDKKVKDAQVEALQNEVLKLRKLYQLQLQNHKKQFEQKETQYSRHHNNQSSTVSQANPDSLPEEFSKLNLGTTDWIDPIPSASFAQLSS
eukprot:c20413_g1_i1 orf=384-1964(-)